MTGEEKKKESFFIKVRRVKSRMAFTGEQLADFKRLLDSERARLLKEQDVLSEEFRTELCDELEPNRSGNHIADINAEGSVISQSLLKNRIKILPKIYAALKRLDEGTFGICLNPRCNKPIDIGRLKSSPFVELCMRCKEEKDAKKKRVTGFKASRESPGRHTTAVFTVG